MRALFTSIRVSVAKGVIPAISRDNFQRHCANCGFVYCSDCCTEKVKLIKFQGYGTKDVKVCEYCSDFVKSIALFDLLTQLIGCLLLFFTNHPYVPCANISTPMAFPKGCIMWRRQIWSILSSARRLRNSVKRSILIDHVDGSCFDRVLQDSVTGTRIMSEIASRRIDYLILRLLLALTLLDPRRLLLPRIHIPIDLHAILSLQMLPSIRLRLPSMRLPTSFNRV
jgi:hypothetical protein